MVIQEKHWSESVCRLAVWLSGLVTFERVAEILEQVGGIPVSSSSVWQQSQKWGKALRAEGERVKIAAQEVDIRNGVVPGEVVGETRMGVSMDGAMIHIRDEGWKEFKLGVVFEVGKTTVLDDKTGEEVEVGCALKNSYAAHLGGPEDFGQVLWAEAQRRQWSRAADTQVVADGATWIWNLVDTHFYDSQQIVDWYHAKQHLAQAAELLYGPASPAGARWLNEQETTLFQGHADEIAHALRECFENG